jgi:putative ABC transport system ATP-binding protein
VAIARALANQPALLLADEPTGELDARTGTEMIGLFDRLNRDGTTIVVVTHDEEMAKAARRVVHMKDGAIVDDRTARPLMDSTLPGRALRVDLDRPNPSGTRKR